MTELHAVGSQDQPVQTEFQGFPVAENMFSLKSVNKLYTESQLEYNQHVKGYFEGRVKGLVLDGDNQRKVMQIEVVLAELST